MSFGEHFQYKKQPKVLAEGIYDVTLQTAFETTVANFRVLRFPFTVDGIREDVRPNYFDLFDCTDPNDRQKLEIFNNRASRIIDCFGLEGSFTENYYALWAGKKGRVEITKSEGGFVNVSRFLPKEAEPYENSGDWTVGNH